MVEDFNIDIGIPVSQYSKVLVRGKAGYSQYTFFTLNGQTYSVDFASAAIFSNDASFQYAVFGDEVEFEAPVYFFDALEFGGNEFLGVSTGTANNENMVTQGYVDDSINYVTTHRLTANTTLTSAHYNVFANTDSASLTLTLPAGIEGKYYRIINTGTSGNAITITPNTTQHLIGANSNFTLQDGESLIIVYNTTDGWY